LYLTPPFTLHNDECDGSFSLYYIHFYEQAIHKESIFDKYDLPVKIRADEQAEQWIKRLQEINPGRQLTHIDPKVYDNQPNFSQFVAHNNKLPLHLFTESQGILSILMSRFLEFRSRKASDKDERIIKSLKYIHSHINCDINLSILAEKACVSEDHFIRLFKKELNQTPIKYINAKKIEKAQLLLITTNWPIRDIAMDLAMDNISYFNKIFKQYTGKTPLEYRKQYEK
ncbi:MAG: AraC family transcriptional regulator, partial [Bacteroidales bacterium]|nr:AraC family transcriptional regulator [Bacteroidales bacterium]